MVQVEKYFAEIVLADVERARNQQPQSEMASCNPNSYNVEGPLRALP
jgi:hypothetical protein